MTMKLNSVFQRYNFYRKPEWRWDRVLTMVDRNDSPGRCTKHDDEFVREARKFTLLHRGAEDNEAREKLFWDNPGLYYAYDFYMKRENPAECEGAMFIEARLLARQNYEQIAAAMTTHPEAVRWYEALFFNVMPYLNARDWITKHVLMPAFDKHHNNVMAPDDGVALPFRDSTVAYPFKDGSLKLFAYFGGPFIVDFMIQGLQAGKPLTSGEDLASWLDKTWSNTVRRRSAQAAMQFEINKYNVTELMAIHSRIIELDNSEEAQDKQKTATDRHIQALIDEIPWAVGDEGKKTYGKTIVGRFDEMAAELRDDELLQLAAGQAVPRLAKDFPERLPPPRKKIQEVGDSKELLQ